MNSFAKLKPLVMMQLKDKLDFSFLKSKRSSIITIALELLKFAIITAVFYLLFFICKLLNVFSAGVIPDTVVNVIFVIIQILSLITCTVGLVDALYMTADNKVLLTFPATPSIIFLSKLIVYFVFELKKNFSFTLPVFLAYGIISGAVLYYYPWMVFCFFFVSALPVILGAVLSIPTLWAMTFVKKRKTLQFSLIVLSAAAITSALVFIINKIPNDIDIVGRWGTISQQISGFLSSFSNFFKPYYLLTQMMVGNTARISSKLFGLDTLLITVCFIAILSVVFALAFFIAKPLFVKTAAKQFEFEKAIIPPKKNRIHKKYFSPYVESLLMNFRSTRFITSVAILLLNRIYAAMNTSFTGDVMTKTFNFLIMLILVLAFNNEYATVFSKEGSARNLIKTRPISPSHILIGRISIRIAAIIFSVIGVISAYLAVSNVSTTEIILMGITTAFVSLAHLFWAAETDVRHSYADQYATVGLQFDNPNERNATIISFLLSAIFAFLYYFLSDRGTLHSLRALLVVSVVFTVYRVYSFIIRVKVYFVEN